MEASIGLGRSENWAEEYVEHMGEVMGPEVRMALRTVRPQLLFSPDEGIRARSRAAFRQALKEAVLNGEAAEAHHA